MSERAEALREAIKEAAWARLTEGDRAHIGTAHIWKDDIDDDVRDVLRALVEHLGLRDRMIEDLNRAVMYISSTALDDLVIALATILEAAGVPPDSEVTK